MRGLFGLSKGNKEREICNRKGSKRMTKQLLAVALSMSMLVALTGCGASSMSTLADKAVMQEMAAEAPMAMEMKPMGGAEMDAGLVNGTGATATESGAATADVTLTERKLIKTVDMSVETREFDKLLSTVEAKVDALGGYIESMNTYNGSYYNYGGTRDANMTLRIPKQNLSDFLNTVEGIANVIRRSEDVRDVTLEYVDLESHKEALRTEQTRLLELLERAESIEDIITIEQRLSDVRYQLESMESRLRTFDNQVDYSTVYLNIQEVEVFTPVEEETVWERISEGFMNSIQNICDGFVEFTVWFIVAIPYLAVWVLIAGGIVLVVTCIAKQQKKKQQKQEEKNQATK